MLLGILPLVGCGTALLVGTVAGTLGIVAGVKAISAGAKVISKNKDKGNDKLVSDR